MSTLFPSGPRISERKHSDAAMRGRTEKNLRVIRGRVDTAGPTILEGRGFSVVRNAAADITMTFDPPFSKIPTISAIYESAASIQTIRIGSAPTASTLRIILTGGADTIIHFSATGPS